MPQPECQRMEKKSCGSLVNDIYIYTLSCTPDAILQKVRCLLEQLRQVTTIFFAEEVKK